MTEEQLRKLRQNLGTESSFSAKGTTRVGRLWNWLIDAEYVGIGPAPIWWVLTALAAGTFCVLVLTQV